MYQQLPLFETFVLRMEGRAFERRFFVVVYQGYTIPFRQSFVINALESLMYDER